MEQEIEMLSDKFEYLKGIVEIITKDRHGNIINVDTYPNIIKIFAKDMLAHRIIYSKLWDTGTDGGSWVDHNIDPDEEFAIKYILLGASFDDDGNPLGQADTRYYLSDPVTGGFIAKVPEIGADNMGDLINPIPISAPDRPLKKVENVLFEPSYQPADSPLLDENVRAINNTVVLETTIRTDEYNGFGSTSSDFFTITEIALAGGKTLEDPLTGCECVPRILFLEGAGGDRDVSIDATANSSATITIDAGVPASDVNRINEGDQILIVGRATTEETYDTIDQVNPYYLVVQKCPGGREFVLDRTPTDSTGTALSGEIGVYRSTLRLFSQRILSTPFKKTDSFEVTIRWRIIMS